MHRLFFNKKAFLVIATALAALLLASGCGGSADADEISVESGSLSKAEFVTRADGICETTRKKFLQGFSAFVEKHGVSAPQETQEVWIGEIVEQILLPNYEDAIEKISTLGAPASEQKDAAAFLNALQRRLDQVEENPSELSERPFPFKSVAKLAGSYGFKGCAGSFA